MCERRPRLRPLKGQPEQPKRATSRLRTAPAEQIVIATPALVSTDQFARVAEQLRENQQRYRLGGRGATHLLQGLLVCGQCGHAFYGKRVTSVYQKRRRQYTDGGDDGHEIRAHRYRFYRRRPRVPIRRTLAFISSIRP